MQPGGRVTLGHSGGFALRAGTAFTLLPSLDLGIVVLTKGAPEGAAEALVAEFLDRVQFGHPTRDWLPAYQGALGSVTAPVGDLVDETIPVDPDPAKRLSRYTGTYKNSYYGKAVVTQSDGRLVVALGPKRRTASRSTPGPATPSRSCPPARTRRTVRSPRRSSGSRTARRSR